MNLELESDRLLLRPLAECDLDIAVEVLTDPEVMRFVGATHSEDQVAEEFETSLRRGAGGAIGIWCTVERSSEVKLGWTILLPLPIERLDTDWSLVGGPDLPDCEVEIGYLLKRSAWGRGYATEAAGRLLRFAFEETALEEVVAVTDPANRASQNVLRKIGLIKEGLRRAYAAECPGFRITRRQWQERCAKAGREVP